jgi:hypothetical protein
MLTHVKLRLRQIVQRVLGLGLLGNQGLLVVVVLLDGLLLLGRLGSLFSLGLLLGLLLGLGLGVLLGGDVLGGRLDVLELAVDLDELGVLDDGLHVSGDVAVLGSGGLVDVTTAGERGKDGRGDKNVGEGHPVTDEEGLVLEDLVEGGQSLLELGKDRGVGLKVQRRRISLSELDSPDSLNLDSRAWRKQSNRRSYPGRHRGGKRSRCRQRRTSRQSWRRWPCRQRGACRRGRPWQLETFARWMFANVSSLVRDCGRNAERTESKSQEMTVEIWACVCFFRSITIPLVGEFVDKSH